MFLFKKFIFGLLGAALWCSEGFAASAGPQYQMCVPAGTILVSATTSSSSQAFNTPLSAKAPNVIVYNAGSNDAFVGCGNSLSGVTAAVSAGAEAQNATPVAAGAIMTITKDSGFDACAAITSTSTSSVFFTACYGQ